MPLDPAQRRAPAQDRVERPAPVRRLDARDELVRADRGIERESLADPQPGRVLVLESQRFRALHGAQALRTRAVQRRIRDARQPFFAEHHRERGWRTGRQIPRHQLDRRTGVAVVEIVLELPTDQLRAPVREHGAHMVCLHHDLACRGVADDRLGRRRIGCRVRGVLLLVGSQRHGLQWLPGSVRGGRSRLGGRRRRPVRRAARRIRRRRHEERLVHVQHQERQKDGE